MLSTNCQYVFVFYSTCYICDSRMMMVIRGQLIVVEINSIMSESPPLCYTLTTLIVMQGHQPDKQETNK